ncbi:MAG: sigma-70 family RNA polymerase sigma factor [Phycisphaerales bacterium]|nr:sigma-70 family RNA polymerase sigma factor [Phycisphaerales bacterium]MCB9863234.1 sigma-70 family RNA polymerase sigma factor [Phycisphaerales bacterium]
MFSHSTTTHGTLLARVSDPTDATAWAEFCAQYEEMIRAFARRQGVFGSSADDIVQDVLMSLTKAMPGFEYNPAKGKFRSYLKTVVVRAIFRLRERDRRASSLDEHHADGGSGDETSLEDVWEEEWRQQHLRRAMRVVESEFNATDLKCFQAYVVEGAETADVAARLGVSADQVYSAKHRILMRLRSIVAAQVEDEG